MRNSFVLIALLFLSFSTFAEQSLSGLFTHQAYEDAGVQQLEKAELLVLQNEIPSIIELADLDPIIAAAISDNGYEEAGSYPSYGPAHKAGAFCAGFCCGFLGAGAIFYITEKDPSMTEFALIGGIGCMVVWGTIYAIAIDGLYYY